MWLSIVTVCVASCVASPACVVAITMSEVRSGWPPPASVPTKVIVYEPSMSLFTTSTFWSPIVVSFSSAFWTLQNGVAEVLTVMQSP